MSLLNVTPETEAILRQEAQERGLTLEHYVTELIENSILEREAISKEGLSKPEEGRGLDDPQATL